MANPTPYAVGYSFAGYQASNPSLPLPATSLDAELANIETSVDSLVDGMLDIRRSDGRLKNGVVTIDSLSVGVIAALANLDATAAASLDAAVALIQDNVDSDIAVLETSKANTVHTHAATAVSVSAISGIVGTTVQAVLAELRALGPQTADFKLSLNPAAPSGWVSCDDGTIGDATSGSTTRANADVSALYTILWNSVSDTYAPVTTGRGASAAIDFAAHKPMALTKMLGRALAIAGAGSNLTARVLGLNVGTETHALLTAEMPSHNHTLTDPGHTHTYRRPNNSDGNAAGGSTSVRENTDGIATGSSTTGITLATAGSGTAHNNMQPTTFIHAFLKL